MAELLLLDFKWKSVTCLFFFLQKVIENNVVDDTMNYELISDFVTIEAPKSQHRPKVQWPRELSLRKHTETGKTIENPKHIHKYEQFSLFYYCNGVADN